MWDVRLLVSLTDHGLEMRLGGGVIVMRTEASSEGRAVELGADEMLLASLGACRASALKQYAEQRGCGVSALDIDLRLRPAWDEDEHRARSGDRGRVRRSSARAVSRGGGAHAADPSMKVWIVDQNGACLAQGTLHNDGVRPNTEGAYIAGSRWSQ